MMAEQINNPETVQSNNQQLPATAQQPIEVAKPFYKKWWFWLIVLIILGTGIYFWMR